MKLLDAVAAEGPAPAIRHGGCSCPAGPPCSYAPGWIQDRGSKSDLETTCDMVPARRNRQSAPDVTSIASVHGALRGQMQWRSHPVLIADSVEPGPCHTWSRDHSWTPGPGSTPERSYTVGRPGTSSPRDVSRGPVLLLQLRPGASFTSGSPWFHDRLMRGMCVRFRLFRGMLKG